MEQERPQLPSLPEWMLRDPLAALGLVLFVPAGFLAFMVVGDVFLSPERLGSRLTGLAVFLVPALILYVTRIRRRWREWSLARRGVPAEARVDQVARGSWTVNDVRYVRAQYTYVVGGSQFQAWTPERHPNELGLSRGERIVVWVDPSNPKRQVWLDPRRDYRTILREERIMKALAPYPGELLFLASVIFVSMVVSLWGQEFADQAHEFARQRDPDMLGLVVGIILMVLSMIVVGRMDSRRTATGGQVAVWLVFSAGFYGPWAATGFQMSTMVFLLFLAGVVWLIVKKGKSGRTA